MPPPTYIRKEKEVCIVTCPETPARTHTKRAFCTRVGAEARLDSGRAFVCLRRGVALASWELGPTIRSKARLLFQHLIFCFTQPLVLTPQLPHRMEHHS